MADPVGVADKPTGDIFDKNTTVGHRTGVDMTTERMGAEQLASKDRQDSSKTPTAAEYCEKVQEWMWQYYYGYMNWHNWVAMSSYPFPPCHPSQTVAGQSPTDGRNWYNNQFPFSVPPYFAVPPGVPSSPADGQTGQVTAGTSPGSTARPAQQQNGNAQQPGREYTIPSPLHRFIAEMVDFFILFFIKATIVLSIMHFSGMKDISKFAMHFIVEEIDEDTSMEELQKMMIVALIYRVLVCFYEIICIWGAGGATPGKFLLGLRVVTCDTSVLVRPNRVLVVPASNVTLSAALC
ncbi:protein FAM8A1 isoform X2 [Amia ocellicauda]|uniref:protein FAM8A1 isoform X2 n=1 Tax=Amia ocellicauda TaxID=2972642 RepID=UPI003464AA57